MIVSNILMISSWILLSTCLPTLLSFNFKDEHDQSIFNYINDEKQSPKDISKITVNNSDTINREDFNKWLDEQKPISFQKILDNIGGLGKSTDEVAEGAVIASPSKSNPNYFYQWVRDAAITMNSLIDYLSDNAFNDEKFNLQPVIESYISNAYHIQRVKNPSGEFKDFSGLGEPKFMPDNTPFEENWGRPQRDGPGLRLITICNYLNVLHKYDREILNNTLLEDELWVFKNVVKPDLQYIINYWQLDGFDLWEEIYSKHLFTSLTQLKALKIGIELHNRFQNNDYDEDKEFRLQLQSTFIALRSFIEVYGFQNSNIPYLIETPTLLWKNTRNGLDIATILLSLISHDIPSASDSIEIPFDVSDPYVINTLSSLVNDMKYRYPINHKRIGLDRVGVALGRYPEDVYNGNGISEGNPWFIATATASEILYKIIIQLYQTSGDRQMIDLTDIPLFQSMCSLEMMEFNRGKNKFLLHSDGEEFDEFAINLVKYADSFLDVIREHVDNFGSMSEQFNKYSGFLEGASDLTWSYGALWSSFRWRDKMLQVMNDNGVKL